MHMLQAMNRNNDRMKALERELQRYPEFFMKDTAADGSARL